MVTILGKTGTVSSISTKITRRRSLAVVCLIWLNRALYGSYHSSFVSLPYLSLSLYTMHVSIPSISILHMPLYCIYLKAQVSTHLRLLCLFPCIFLYIPGNARVARGVSVNTHTHTNTHTASTVLKLSSKHWTPLAPPTPRPSAPAHSLR